jgi:hypothetical protein
MIYTVKVAKGSEAIKRVYAVKAIKEFFGVNVKTAKDACDGVTESLENGTSCYVAKGGEFTLQCTDAGHGSQKVFIKEMKDSGIIVDLGDTWYNTLVLLATDALNEGEVSLATKLLLLAKQRKQ